MRVEWVHPSWRDLVIEHLAEDADARARFLTGCSAHGVLLALSVAGGEHGDRELPLLATDADWDVLTDRLYTLVPQLDASELAAVLDSVGHAAGGLGPSAATVEGTALARTVLKRVTDLWSQSDDAIPLPLLEAWLGAASRLPPGVSQPEPPELARTWAGLLPATAPELDDREGLERFADWLTLADLLRAYNPDALRRFRFRDCGHILNTFLDRLETAGGRVDPAVGDHVERAINRIESLDPALGNMSLYFRRRLSAARRELPRKPTRRSAPLPGELPGWRQFDVARVLNDL